MLLLLLSSTVFLFKNSFCWIPAETISISDPFKYRSNELEVEYRHVNFVSLRDHRDEMTGKLVTNYDSCVLKRKLGDYIGPNTAGEVDLTEIIDKKIMLGEVEWRIYDEEFENRDNSLCVETEPGHLALKKASEEEIGCTHKNQFHPYRSHWDDLEMGASLFCDDHKKVVKNRCAVNGLSLWVSPFIDYKLSNGCTFICNDQKNIIKCPEQLPFLEVMKTATTRIPTTLRNELGF
ncbi:hypothetical protein CAEBREN_02257 [Caenorhabditis brenneri]|uniref:Leishmanolysin-like peptidase n=1 Tax=Caenorhabditis brenneri TaxID=135651 RepID=G0N150_CAEBE|nr:hypothetical protein CAEBREN_02257 [Caenorhabditis brenneri]